MRIIYKLLLTINATSTMVVIYLVKESYYILLLEKQPMWVSHILFALVPLLLTIMSVAIKGLLSKDNINYEMKSIEEANNAFLPSYLGYFFVALSINSVDTMIFVYMIVIIFTYFSQTSYFNPLFLLLGYKFYYITTVNNVKLLIISKKEINSTSGLTFPKLRRINNTTFIDEEDTR